MYICTYPNWLLHSKRISTPCVYLTRIVPCATQLCIKTKKKKKNIVRLARTIVYKPTNTPTHVD